ARLPGAAGRADRVDACGHDTRGPRPALVDPAPPGRDRRVDRDAGPVDGPRSYGAGDRMEGSAVPDAPARARGRAIPERGVGVASGYSMMPPGPGVAPPPT